MRKDIKKVICETPRVAGDDNNRRYQRRKDKKLRSYVCKETGEIEYLNPNNLGMNISSKERTDFLPPIYGWAAKCIGKNFDKCWSELCSNLRGQSVLVQHVKQHAKQIIIQKNLVHFVDGKPHILYRYGYTEIECTELYVDPRDNRVKIGTKPAQRRGITVPWTVTRTPRLKHTHQETLSFKGTTLPILKFADKKLVCRNTIWYEASEEPLEDGFIWTFRQLNKKEVKAYNLRA